MNDSCFIRGEIPMTKSEIRAVSLSKLELGPDSVIYDVGAGTGSVSVEAAVAAFRGHVYAFEQKEEGCRLIHENAAKFSLDNITVICGKAPEAMEPYPAPDAAFIGGSGGEIGRILDLLFEKNPNIRVVINAIALETLSEITDWFQKRKTEPDISCIQVSRAALRGKYHMMQGMNPVYVIAAGGQAGGEERKTPEPGRQGGVRIPRVMLAAASSGSGKTVITAGLLAAFKRRGIDCTSFKCGPDYLDPMFHQYVLGIPGCNLDSFFLGPDQVRRLFVKKAQTGGLAVLEGVMGYYDGAGGNTLYASSYEIASITETPVILVADGRGSSLSLAALIQGFREYRRDSRIVGVILNRTSPAVAERLREPLERMGIRVFGAVPECPEAVLESRHLGLTAPGEQTRLREKLDKLAGRLEQCLDLDGIWDLAGKAGSLPEENQSLPEENGSLPGEAGRKLLRPSCPPRRIAVARDEAFSFYYEENLELLRESGWELAFFSPLKDEALPEKAGAVLLGGGYPELYAAELSANTAMLRQIRRAAGQGVKILAECGGFLYLHKTLEGEDGIRYPMAGLIDGDGFKKGKLGHFGYITLSDQRTGTRTLPPIKGHEFHYWDSTSPGTDFLAEKPVTGRSWSCMHVTDQMAAGFPHLYYPSCPQWILSFLEGEQP
ncbi:MAG: cobyrinate a,c-diamide synthase [Eubacteriales bacterium]|nr:cobyrinate a,c-diamide synthase [Eubacteriales bacterium]